MLGLKKAKQEIEEMESVELLNEVVLVGEYTRKPKLLSSNSRKFMAFVKTNANNSTTDIPIILRNTFALDDFNTCPLYSIVKVKGHLEYPMSLSGTGHTAKYRLDFVADELEVIHEKGAEK